MLRSRSLSLPKTPQPFYTLPVPCDSVTPTFPLGCGLPEGTTAGRAQAGRHTQVLSKHARRQVAPKPCVTNRSIRPVSYSESWVLWGTNQVKSHFQQRSLSFRTFWPLATRGRSWLKDRRQGQAPGRTFGYLPVVAEAPAQGDGDGRQVPQAVRGALHAAVDARAAHGLRRLVG